MPSQILFRSFKSGRDRTWDSCIYTRQRGLSWSHIRPYTDTDDIRDIVWSKIKPEGLSVRSRENHGDFEIISYWGTTPYDDFTIHDGSDSRNSAIQKARQTMKISTKIWQYSYREFFGDTGFAALKKIKPNNALIFICNTDSLEDLQTIAFHNDLIYLDLSHPFESNPDTSLLFSGQILDLESYMRKYREFRKSKIDLIKKIRAAYIPLSTQDDITITLNTFFKKRYKNG